MTRFKVSPDLLDIEEKFVHRYFSRFYRGLTQRRLGPIYRAIAAETLAGVDAGKILDLGCGPGNLLIELALAARAAGKRTAAIGLDNSPELVAEGQRAIERAGLAAAASLEFGDAHALPFAAGEFAAVVSTGSIHHWRRPATVLAEIHRVLADRGRLLIYDQRRPAGARDLISAFRQGFVGLGLTALGDRQLVELAEASPFESVEVATDGMLIKLVLKKSGRAGRRSRGN